MVEKGKFPAQPIKNPKGQLANGNSGSNNHFEYAKFVNTLRNGKVLDNKVQEVPREPKDNPEE